MARKIVGYVKLEWVCPNCNTRNPGPVKTCSGCGAPQPADVQFIRPRQSELISDEKEIAQAKAGPDVHCPFCGTRNSAEAEICTQCGGDLREAHARQSGQVIGAFEGQAAPLICPHCAAENPPDASFCISCGAPLGAVPAPAQPVAASAASAPTAGKKINPVFIIIPAILGIIACILLVSLLNKRTDVTARVVDISWTRSIDIEEYGPVSSVDWYDSIPAGADIGSCESTYRYTSSNPEPNAMEVCSTAYIEDEGTGYGEVVMDCVYQVYEDRCEYISDQWYTLTTLSSDGTGQGAAWPDTNVGANQREGASRESYTITFADGSDTYTYSTSNYAEYLDFPLGSEWDLSVNAFGDISDIQPAP